jgi:hypothetical protein
VPPLLLALPVLLLIRRPAPPLPPRPLLVLLLSLVPRRWVLVRE